MPRFLERQLAFIERGHLDVAFTDAVLFGGPDDGWRYLEINRSHGPITLVGLLRMDVVLLSSSMLITSAMMGRLGGYDERRRGVEDYDLLLRLARAGARMAYQEEVLVRYRRHPGSVSASEARMIGNALELLDELDGSAELTAEETAALRHGRARLKGLGASLEAREALRSGDVDRARQALASATQIPRLRRWAARAALRLAPRAALAAYRWRTQTRRPTA
jgi:hypothetical protein